MRFWIGGPRIGWFRPGVSFGIAATRFSRSQDTSARTDGGYVYVVERDGDHRVKIGSSIDPPRRLPELQTGNADRLSIAYSVPVAGNAKNVEHRAHDILDRHRGLGEWFAVPVDVAIAAIHAAGYQVGDNLGEARQLPKLPRLNLNTFLVYALIVCVALYSFTH